MIPGIEADDRVHGVLEQDRGAERARLSGGRGPARVRLGVEQLDEVRVLEDVQAVPGRPLRRDAPGVRDPVPVEHRRSAPRLRQRRAALRPEMPGDEPDIRLDALPARYLREAQEVVREPHEHGDPEPAHQGDLLDRRGVAAGAGGKQPRSGEVQERLADVVPAVHHPEPVHRVHDVVVPEPVQAIGAREKGVLDLPVPRPVEDRLGIPRRAARGMEHRRVAAVRPPSEPPGPRSIPWKSPKGGWSRTLSMRSRLENGGSFERSSRPRTSPGSSPAARQRRA